MTRQPLPAASTLRRAILLAASLLALTRPASAATITVNTFAQGSVAGCSLAEAIASINAGADGVAGCVAVVAVDAYGTNDTIILPFGTYPFTVADNPTNGLPIITESLTINGNGATLARTLGNVAPFFRFFEVTAGNLTLNSLTLTGGNPGAGTNGGAVLDSSTGTLTITSCTFSGNTAQDDGGAIHKSGIGGDLTVTGSTFTNNTATNSVPGDAEGGAIFAETTGNLTVTGSTFTNNTATSSAGDADGGAIKTTENSGNLTVTGSTFTNNTATSSAGDADGGAIGAESASVTVTSSTFTNNTATSSGGDADGGALDADSDSVTVTSSTFTNNAATSSGTTDDDDGAIGGGAIKMERSGTLSTLSVTSSIFVNNRATRSGADNASRGGALLDESSTTSAVNNNCFVGNTAQSGGGVFRGGSPTVNAENNWWGAANGPSEAGFGSGDGVSSNVDFDPFLTSAPFAGCILAIPTLSEWAKLGMIALLVAGGLLALRRTKRAIPTRPA